MVTANQINPKTELQVAHKSRSSSITYLFTASMIIIPPIMIGLINHGFHFESLQISKELCVASLVGIILNFNDIESSTMIIHKKHQTILKYTNFGLAVIVGLVLITLFTISITVIKDNQPIAEKEYRITTFDTTMSSQTLDYVSASAIALLITTLCVGYLMYMIEEHEIQHLNNIFRPSEN